jgi:hypothetical protein
LWIEKITIGVVLILAFLFRYDITPIFGSQEYVYLLDRWTGEDLLAGNFKTIVEQRK